LQLFIQSAETILEPGAFDRNPQTTEALLEQLLIRQLFPSIFPTWHRHPEVTEKTVLDGVTGHRRQQPPSLRGVPLFSARDGFGSNSEVQARNREVRFSLKNRHRQAGLSGPKSANKRLMRRS
jgi:hypothetical protein